MNSNSESKEISVSLTEEEDKHDDSAGGNVKVICRFRPLNENELNRGGENV